MPITLQGYDRLFKRVQQLPAKVQTAVAGQIKKGAFDMNAQAVRNIKANDSIGVSGGGGGLIGSQAVVPIKDSNIIGFEVINGAPYAPFVEFGTGRRVSVPAEWRDYAAQFKGTKLGGNIDDFLRSIIEWVRAKGLAGRYSTKTQRRIGSRPTQDQEDLAVAYPIFRSILENGANPHPFLYPAYVQVKPQIIKSIQLEVRNAIKQ